MQCSFQYLCARGKPWNQTTVYMCACVYMYTDLELQELAWSQFQITAICMHTNQRQSLSCCHGNWIMEAVAIGLDISSFFKLPWTACECVCTTKVAMGLTRACPSQSCNCTYKLLNVACAHVPCAIDLDLSLYIEHCLIIILPSLILLLCLL